MLEVVLFVAVGFLAQLIDGALGMAYGVTATSVLLQFGTPPAVASASVHAAEAFTTGASALSHWRLRNVDWRLVVRLAVPGVVGGVAGAYLLSSFPGHLLRPVVSLYLLAMGVVIIVRALRSVGSAIDLKTHPVTLLGLCGGFLDAVGGGGWGPIVASRLIGSGGTPRYVIGSVNCAEFFLTFTISLTFFATIGLKLWPVITGLIIGGVLAAPLGALAAARIRPKPLMFMVGCLVSVLSIINLATAFRDFL
ncbi:MAG TPA: sulfite exporter TauE/SafE family protein [Propylenella sp.]